MPVNLDDVVFSIGTKSERFMKTFEETDERFLLVDCVEDSQRTLLWAGVKENACWWLLLYLVVKNSQLPDE